MKRLTLRRSKLKKASPRRQELKAHRQSEILAAAFAVFAVHGYEAARIDDVARQAGIAKGTIYLYFRDKKQLFQAVVRNLIPKRFDVLLKTLPGAPDELLRTLLSQVYTNVVRNEHVPSIFRMLIAESERFPELAEIYHREIIVPGMKAMREVLKRGMEQGTFRKSQALEFPQIVVAPALLAMVWQLLFGTQHPLNLKIYMQAHLDFVLRSLAASRG